MPPTSIRAARVILLGAMLVLGTGSTAVGAPVALASAAPPSAPAVATPAANARKVALGVAMIPWDATALDNFTASVDGHVPALWTIWNDWGGSNPAFPTALAQQVAARGATPMIWWQPVTTGNLNDSTFTNQKIIDGNFDAYIRQWAQDAKAFGGLVVVRYAHEMECNWFPWGVGRNGNTAANYIAAWQHIWNIFRGPGGEGATNVRFLWSPYVPNAAVYPGAAYVDYVGFTALNWAGVHGQPWYSMNRILSGLVTKARKFNKPIIVAEMGSNPVGGSKAAWISAGYAAAYANYPDIVALVYFNVDTSPGQADWRLTTPADALTAYRAILAQPEFQGTLGLPPLTLAINDVSVHENAGPATFTVKLSEASAQTVTVNYSTADNTATAPADYTTTSGMLTFSPGDLSKTINVPIVDDSVYEPTQTFFVNLSGPSNAAIADGQGVGTIVDNDPQPGATISIGNASVREGSRRHGTVRLVFRVTLSHKASTKVTVHYATANGTATAGSDYIARHGTLTIKKGKTSARIVITVKSDKIVEPNEILYVNLSRATKASIAVAQGVGTILNDD